MNHEYNEFNEWLTQPSFVRLVKFVVKTIKRIMWFYVITMTC